MLEFEEYKAKLNAAKPSLELLRGALKLEAAQKEIEELEAASERDGFWNDVENSQRVQKRLKVLKGKVENYEKLCAAWDDMMTMCEMAMEENDDSMLEELKRSSRPSPRRWSPPGSPPCSPASMTPTTPSSPSTPAPAAPKPRTGPPCSTACTTCGPTATATR